MKMNDKEHIYLVFRPERQFQIVKIYLIWLIYPYNSQGHQYIIVTDQHTIWAKVTPLKSLNF